MLDLAYMLALVTELVGYIVLTANAVGFPVYH